MQMRSHVREIVDANAESLRHVSNHRVHRARVPPKGRPARAGAPKQHAGSLIGTPHKPKADHTLPLLAGFGRKRAGTTFPTRPVARALSAEARERRVCLPERAPASR